jgi:hypothetical protein
MPPTVTWLQPQAGVERFPAHEHQCHHPSGNGTGVARTSGESSSTTHMALNGRELPTLDQVLAIVTARAGAEQRRNEFTTAWRVLVMTDQGTAHKPRRRGLYPGSETT